VTKGFEGYDAVALAELIAKGDVSPEELLEAAIASTEECNGDINAVVTKMYEEAERFVQEDLPSDGPLRGVPFLLKDLRAQYAGIPTTAGSRFFTDAIPDHDSELVIRYKNAGLVIFGKTNTPEFGGNCSTEPILFGPTKNPWNLNRTSGGSSGGAGAVVAARILPAAHGSDGGGSIRIPASCCGVFGLKPTRGRNPAGPDFGEAWSGLSVEHALTTSVRDSAVILDASEGPAPGDPYVAPPKQRPYSEEVGRDPGQLKIAFSTTARSGVPVDADCLLAVEQTALLCEELGHQVIETEPSFDGAELGEAVRRIIGANMMAGIVTHSKATGREPGTNDIERVIQLRSGMGDEITGTHYALALQTIHRVGRVIGRFMTNFDVIMTPTVARPPLMLGELNTDTDDVPTFLQNLYGFIPFTAVFNATGQPAMSVPLHWNGDGLPIGVQFASAYGDEATLFRLAGQLEQARPWADRRPPVNVED
jgi:Asp-tRNA(Asn)/Glu-tRNA(Gln) amidotransferase A subunit family amidase